jgi:FtsP/CotA-like multicopper oxidase with cupredoxin domain
MSILGKKIPGSVVAGVAGLLVVLALLPVMTRSVDREITLVARGMRFYLATDPNTPNPTITVKAGETVRVVFQNQDRGMTHDFAVPTLNAGVDLINWNESDSVTFDVPSEPGTYEYVCNPHRLMMMGTIKVIP